MRACPICAGTHADKYLEVNECVWVRCASCGLFFVKDVPFDDPSELYADYYVGRCDAGRQQASDAAWSQWDAGSRPQFRAISESCWRRRRGRLLDVGCGAGFFLDICRSRGYEVEGIELSGEAAEYGRRVLGLPIMQVPIDRIDRPPASYDVISFNNVLEHLPDPMKAIRTAFTLLTENGILTVSVPNVTFAVALRSLAGFLGTRSARRAVLAVQAFQAPVHLTAFSRRTLTLAVATGGFGSIELMSEYPVFNPRRLMWNTMKLVQYSGSEAVRILSRQRLLIGHGITLFAIKRATP
jgi:2-polyprenyl-3-methyl-5-hydroxy-6-metoxy-1,4-benzoquinol methylase